MAKGETLYVNGFLSRVLETKGGLVTIERVSDGPKSVITVQELDEWRQLQPESLTGVPNSTRPNPPLRSLRERMFAAENRLDVIEKGYDKSGNLVRILADKIEEQGRVIAELKAQLARKGAKQDKDEFRTYTFKVLLNSLYGKLGGR